MQIESFLRGFERGLAKVGMYNPSYAGHGVGSLYSGPMPSSKMQVRTSTASNTQVMRRSAAAARGGVSMDAYRAASGYPKPIAAQ
jgi:hypothetical protein